MWSQVGSTYSPLMRVMSYNSYSSTRVHVDEYFSYFLSNRYATMSYQERLLLSEQVATLKDETQIEKVHVKWRWGEPKRTSAFKNLVRFNFPVAQPVDQDWKLAMEWAKQHFSFMGNSSINWDLPYATQCMNMSTSPGFPYSRGYDGAPPLQSKRDYFAYQNGKFARDNYFSYLNRISQKDYNPTSWYTCSVKKEMRKQKKIDADDYRAYLAANVDNTIAGNAATLEMNQKFYNSWPYSASFVGGSTFHGCWNHLFKRLEKHPHAYEMDVSAWDSTLSEYLIQSLRDVMWSFVRFGDRTPLNKIRWDNLFKEIYMSLVIMPNGDVYFKCQGNPSGSFLTIVTNTIIHYMLFCYAWIRMCPDPTNYAHFSREVELALCGDDSLYTVSDYANLWFATPTIIPIWKSLGINAKMEAVSSGELKARQFLSQSTLKIGKYYVPYPDYDKTVSSMLWHTRAHNHIRWSYLKACALRMSSFFNRDLNKLFADYIQYLETSYALELRVECRGGRDDPFTWDQVHSVYKDDASLWRLYTMQEDNQSAVNMSDLISLCHGFPNEKTTIEETSCPWDQEVGPGYCLCCGFQA